MKSLIEVGDHTLAICCQSERFYQFVLKWFESKSIEVQKQSNYKCVDLTVDIEQGYGVPFVDYHVDIKEVADCMIYRRADYQLRISKDYRKAKLQAHDELAFKHALMNLYSAFIVHNGWGLLIHSSCVEHQSQAYLFAGHSGSGKSTVSQLSSPRPILSDEATLIRIGEDEMIVYDSPFRSEIMAPYPNRFCQLSKIFFLNQSIQNGIAFVNKANSMMGMLDKIFYWPHDPLETAKLLKMCRHLIEHVPVFQLYFQKNDTFWEMIS